VGTGNGGRKGPALELNFWTVINKECINGESGRNRAGEELTSQMKEIREAMEVLQSDDRLLLAVSGGRDSMVLLDAVARWRPETIAAVATFDHGTGEFAKAAVELVRSVAQGRGIAFVHGFASDLRPTEASWRSARWKFLRESALRSEARVATAHTLDDQVETVFIRLLRDAGPRGLAGLFAQGDVARPLVRVPRAVTADYAERYGVQFLDDPSNDSMKYLRNRVRRELLPACEAVSPGFSHDLVEISRRAASWRQSVEALAASLEPWQENGSVFVRADAILAFDAAARAVLWPAIVARAGVTLDRRGTERLAAFSTQEGRVQRMQLAGGHEIIRRSLTYEVRPAAIT
jgi:tRNA(Ile)-lysidine synthase